MRKENLQTITDTQSWYKILPLNGFNLIGAKQKFTKVSLADSHAKSFLHWQILGVWQSLCRVILESYIYASLSRKKGIAERTVHRINEGTSAVLLQSGLDEKWRAVSMECNCYLRNVQDSLSGKHPHERRFGEPFSVPELSFGSMIECHPISAKDQSWLHQFGKKVLPGIFLWYVLYAGLGIWKGDIMVADIEELENMNASQIHPRRIDTQEVLTPQRVNISFSRSQLEQSSCLEGIRVFRRTTSLQDHLARGEEHNDDLQRESEKCEPLDTPTDDGGVRKRFLDDR